MFDSFHFSDRWTNHDISHLDAEVQHAVVLMLWPSCTSGGPLETGNVWTPANACPQMSSTLKSLLLTVLVIGPFTCGAKLYLHVTPCDSM